MKKILSAILALFYLFIFILCVQSLGEPRNFGALWVWPAFFMILFHIVILFKKSVTLDFRTLVAILDCLFCALPFLLFGTAFLGSVISIIFAVPFICAVLSFIFIRSEKKNNKKN